MDRSTEMVTNTNFYPPDTRTMNIITTPPSKLDKDFYSDDYDPEYDHYCRCKCCCCKCCRCKCNC